MLFFPNIDSINVYFKVGKIYFINNKKKKLKNDVAYNFTEITDHHGEISVMVS